MNGMKLFDQVNLSVEEEKQPEVVAVELDPTELILAEEAMAEIMDIENQYNVGQEAIALAETVVDGLGKQLAVESQVLAKPEQVTTATVILSMETLKTSAAILGAKVDVDGISVEDIDTNPAEALTIAVEAKENFMQKAIDTIKLMFKKFVNMLKKLYTKAVVAMNGSAKKAEALVAKLKENEKEAEKTVKLDDKLKSKVEGKIGAVVVKIGGGKLDAAFAKQVANNAENATMVTAIASSIKGLSDRIKKAADGFGDEVKGKELADALKDIKGFGGTYVKFSAMTAKKLVVSVPSVDEGKDFTKEEALKVIAKVTCKVETETVDGKEFKTEEVKYTDIIAIAEAVIKPAKNIKSFMGKVEETTKLAEAKVEEAAKNGEEVYMPVVKFGNVIVGSAAMDLVLGALNNINGILSVANTLGQAAMGEEKKEGKEEDEGK